MQWGLQGVHASASALVMKCLLSNPDMMSEISPVGNLLYAGSLHDLGSWKFSIHERQGFSVMKGLSANHVSNS